MCMIRHDTVSNWLLQSDANEIEHKFIKKYIIIDLMRFFLEHVLHSSMSVSFARASFLSFFVSSSLFSLRWTVALDAHLQICMFWQLHFAMVSHMFKFILILPESSSSAGQPSNARAPKYKQTRNTTKSATEKERRSREKRSQNDSRKKGEKQMQRLPHTNNYGNENDYSLILLVCFRCASRSFGDAATGLNSINNE